MTGPQRVQMSRQRPWRAEHPDAVIVARPSRWGNPVAVRKEPGRVWVPDRGMVPHWSVVCLDQPQLNVRYVTSELEARRVAVDLFATHRGPMGCFEPDNLDEWLEPLRGRDLACWCPLGPCHADVLLDWANR